MLLHSLLVSEEKQYRSVPEVLAGVLTLEEYQRLMHHAVREARAAARLALLPHLRERAQVQQTRVRGTRLVKLATLCPCVFLFCVGQLLRVVALLDDRLLRRLEELCETASNERVRLRARRLGGVGEGLSPGEGVSRQRQQYWIDVVLVRSERPPTLVGARGGLYELPPPALDAEKPPRPHSPPVFSSSSEGEEENMLR